MRRDWQANRCAVRRGVILGGLLPFGAGASSSDHRNGLPQSGIGVPEPETGVPELETGVPAVALDGSLLQIARAFWVLVAAASLVLWIVEAPLYYHAALHLQNTNGMVSLSPAKWRAGLHGLGLSPSFYAAQSLATLSIMTWPMFLAGLLIFLRRSNEWIALFISLVLVTFGTGIISGYAAGPALLAAHPQLSALLQASMNFTNLSYDAIFLIPLVFPDGRFVPRWSGWLAGIFVLLFIAQAVAPGSALDFSHWPVWLVGPLNVVWFAAVLLAPIYRYRRVSDRLERQQTKWVMFGLVVALGVFLTLGLLQALIPGLTATPQRAVLLDLVGGTLAFLGFTVLPVCFAIAILRYRLWDIDLILNRALVYGTLTTSVIALYVLIVVGLGSRFQAQGNIAFSLLATALVAILFHPFREYLQRGVNRLLYGERDEPYAVLSRLGQRLEGTLAPDSVLSTIVETVASALRLPYAAIEFQQGESFELAASVGSSSDHPLPFPLVYRGETLGRLLLGPRPGETGFTSSDRRLLDDLARQAGVAAHAVRLTGDLQRSRERLITAREEERRRLRRDLHDGLGPALASVTLMADASRNLLRHDPAAADMLLADLKAEAQRATIDIRRVVYELRPPALDEFGLVTALREQGERYSRNGLQVTVDGGQDLPPLSAAVEVAAYRIAQEALTNVVRHAGAQRCAVRISVDEALVVEIDDDGRGLDGTRPGVGLTSMRERAEELGGTLTIEPSPPGGTRVVARLPRGSAS